MVIFKLSKTNRPKFQHMYRAKRACCRAKVNTKDDESSKRKMHPDSNLQKEHNKTINSIKLGIDNQRRKITNT